MKSKQTRIKQLFAERYFWECYRKRFTAKDIDILQDVNKYLAALNNEYYTLLFK